MTPAPFSHPGGDAEPGLADRLAEYHEALIAGRPPGGGGLPPELAACLERLEQDRRGSWPADVLPPPGRGIVFDPVRRTGRFGRFGLRRELGRGGFGVVFLAWDPLYRRPVALKVPRPEALLAPALRRRFLREARAVAGLDHPNIVPVYEAGSVGPICYIASAYCDGSTLAQWLRRQPGAVPARTAAALVAPLAEAMDYTHRRGVLHRDLKPANVLLTADGRPRVTDFGLARLGAGAEERRGPVLGTPAYMAPEQAGGRPDEVGPHTDVYALGGILYEALTGQPPFRGESVPDTLQRVRFAELVPPRVLRPDCPRELEAVCLRCLAREPNRRYPSARALADDLRRFLDLAPKPGRMVRAAHAASLRAE